MEVNDVKPENQHVLVEVEKLEEVSEGLYVGNQNAVETDAHPTEFYIGKIHKFGPKAKDKDQCPSIEEGKYAIFSQWSGHALATKGVYTKIIPAYNIVAISDSLEMTKEELKPTNDRILVELIEDQKVEDEVYIGDHNDPREAVTQKGKVIKCGINSTGYSEGTVVFFEPHAGNLIVNKPGEQIKTLNSRDILCTL